MMHVKYPDIDICMVDDLEEAVKSSDIIDCVTLANVPFIRGAWLKKGSLVMNMADFEVDYDCVKRADKVVVDYWEAINSSSRV